MSGLSLVASRRFAGQFTRRIRPETPRSRANYVRFIGTERRSRRQKQPWREILACSGLTKILVLGAKYVPSDVVAHRPVTDSLSAQSTQPDKSTLSGQVWEQICQVGPGLTSRSAQECLWLCVGAILAARLRNLPFVARESITGDPRTLPRRRHLTRFYRMSAWMNRLQPGGNPSAWFVVSGVI